MSRECHVNRSNQSPSRPQKQLKKTFVFEDLARLRRRQSNKKFLSTTYCLAPSSSNRAVFTLLSDHLGVTLNRDFRACSNLYVLCQSWSIRSRCWWVVASVVADLWSLPTGSSRQLTALGVQGKRWSCHPTIEIFPRQHATPRWLVRVHCVLRGVYKDNFSKIWDSFSLKYRWKGRNVMEMERNRWKWTVKWRILTSGSDQYSLMSEWFSWCFGNVHQVEKRVFLWSQHPFLLPGTSWRSQQEHRRRNWTNHPGQAGYQAPWLQQAHANQQRHRADPAGSARHPEQPRADGVPAVTWLPRAHLLKVFHHWWVELLNRDRGIPTRVKTVPSAEFSFYP